MINLSTVQVKTSDLLLPYTVGPLLYTPATNEKITSMLIHRKVNDQYSLALCLEDAIADGAVEFGKTQIKRTLQALWKSKQQYGFLPDNLPKIFIRVSHPNQISELFYYLEKYQEFVCGFILPKYSIQNADSYHRNILKINAISSHRIWMLPIMENQELIPLHTRSNILARLKEAADSMQGYILNIRVGSNDLLKDFGLRRTRDNTIYDILPVSSILSDVITTFGQDYVVSGPVYEYFSGSDASWANGFRREIALDKLNGFIGKTVIHPNQIPIVNEVLKVSKADYEDAKNILDFEDPLVQVVKSAANDRMNEIKTHYKWAEKTLLLASVYGVSHE